MTVAEVHRLFDSSPAIRLVRRKENAPLVVAFLFSAFKADGVTGPRLLSQVNDALEAFLGEMAEIVEVTLKDAELRRLRCPSILFAA